MAQLLGLRGPWRCQVCGTRTASAAAVMALSESLLKPLVAGDQKSSLASLSPQLCPFGHSAGSFALGPSPLFRLSGTYWGALGGVLL